MSHTLLDRAENLVREGDIRAAIALLENEGSTDDTDVVRRLVDLRIEAYGQVEWPDPPTSWPPPHDDRFAGVDGFPEIERAELDVGALRAGVWGKGGLIVRGLMPSAELRAQMRANIDRSLEARYAYYDEKQGANGNPWYLRSPLVRGETRHTVASNYSPNSTGTVRSVDSPPFAFELINFYNAAGLPELVQAYFGERPVLSVRKWVVRRIGPNPGNPAGWHQDGRFLGDLATMRAINVWIALSDCGGEAPAPGLEILADNRREIYETGTHGAPFQWTVGQELVDRITEDCPARSPAFKAGDAIFFDHYNLHRTDFAMHHTANRYAIETWWFAGSTAPMKQQPVVI